MNCVNNNLNMGKQNIAKGEIFADSIGWDSANWGRALDFWSRYCNFRGKKVLELGCGCDNGGLSLWAAALGAEKVLCSDYHFPRETTIRIHKKWGFSSIIGYGAIDALNIPFYGEFDVVIFKSVLGGIVRKGDLSIAGNVLSEAGKALRDGGVVLFAENLAGSFLHRILRARFGAGKNNWRYFNNYELPALLKGTSQLELVDIVNLGFLGCFGRTEKQRILLGKFDKLLMEKLVPLKYLYIQCIIAQKVTGEKKA